MRRRSRKRQRIRGLVPRLGQVLWVLERSAIRHPSTLLLCAIIGASAWAVWAHGGQAEIFRIVEVNLPAHSSLKLREPLIGEPIWSVNLEALAESLHAQQPWLKEVRVIRQLPNTLRIHTVERLPVAQVQMGGWHPVDREGVILPQASATPIEGLVRLVGVSQQDALQRGLRIRTRLSRSAPTLARRITDINVADEQAIRLMMDGAIEVRCGSEAELAMHLKRLEAALKTMAKQPLAIRYIDVRFSEPVIGPRT
jgi:cell division septal protein FtsQ